MLLSPTTLGYSLDFTPSLVRESRPDEHEAYLALMAEVKRAAEQLMDEPVRTGLDVDVLGHIYWLGIADGSRVELLCAPKQLAASTDCADFEVPMAVTEIELGKEEMLLMAPQVAKAVARARFVSISDDGFNRSQEIMGYGVQSETTAARDRL